MTLEIEADMIEYEWEYVGESGSLDYEDDIFDVDIKTIEELYPEKYINETYSTTPQ